MADGATPLGSDWLRAHPVPRPDPDADKNGRGRVLAVGGCTLVPGGLLLTAEAALRAGAGKVQLATIAPLALPLGVAMPEAAVFAMGQTAGGEIDPDEHLLLRQMERCDAVIAGPAMACADAGAAVVDCLLHSSSQAVLVLDAAALQRLSERSGPLRESGGAVILTPHAGEMAGVLGCEMSEIAADPAGCVLHAARRLGAVTVLKGPTSHVAAPSGELFSYAGGGVGLATGGSGDVLAGIAAGLAARGTGALEAALWAVWLHGEAGRRCTERWGPVGYLARELLSHVPGLMRSL